VIERSRDALRSKYLSLGTGELVAASVFVVVAATAVAPRFGRPAQLALWFAAGPLFLVLIQGGGYWLAARRWVGRGAMPTRLARLYRVLRIADPILLAGGLVGVWIWWPASGVHALTAVLVWLFGVVEYLNYFVVRLSYPIRSWPTGVRQRRIPRLVQDIQSSSR
jgi:hypothetical protein